MEAAELELSQSGGAARGKLRLSLPLIGMLLMPLINDFMRAYPQIELDLDFSDRFVEVIEEGFDAVVRTGELTDSRLMSRTITTFTYVVVGAPAYFAGRTPPVRPQDLAHHICLHHRYPSTGKLEPLIAMAEAGLGLTYVPLFSVRRQVSDGSLTSVLQPWMKRRGTLRILWPSSRHTSSRIRTFVDFMS